VTADEIRAHIDPIRHEFAEERSLVLPALKFAQTEKGHLTQDDIVAVAEAVNLTPAYVESVASFYDRLYLEPTGGVVFRLHHLHPVRVRRAARAMCHREAPPHGGTAEDGIISIQEARVGYLNAAVQVEPRDPRTMTLEAATSCDDLRRPHPRL